MTDEKYPAMVYHPGEYIKEEIEARGWTQRELANRLDVHHPHINRIIRGTLGISAQMALKLADAFETSAEFWANLDTQYRLFLARQEVMKNEKET